MFQEHENYYCLSEKHGPLLLSIRMDKDPAQYRLLLRYSFVNICNFGDKSILYRTKNYTHYSVMPSKNLAKKFQPEEFASVSAHMHNKQLPDRRIKYPPCVAY